MRFLAFLRYKDFIYDQLLICRDSFFALCCGGGSSWYVFCRESRNFILFIGFNIFLDQILFTSYR